MKALKFFSFKRGTLEIESASDFKRADGASAFFKTREEADSYLSEATEIADALGWTGSITVLLTDDKLKTGNPWRVMALAVPTEKTKALTLAEVKALCGLV